MRVTTFLVTILVATGLFGGVKYFENQQTNIHNTQPEFLPIETEALEDIWLLLQEKYVDPTVFQDVNEFKYSVIKGMVNGLNDPYSQYFSPEENEDFLESLAGEFQGIGAELTTKDGVIMVVTPLKGSPAKAAGLMPEDIILSVDGEDIQGMDLLEVVKNIRGEKGTEVILEIFRSSEGETLDIAITRDIIDIPSVEGEMKGNIAYIEMNMFGDHTTQEFRTIFEKLLSQNPEGIILDLRFNGGGLLDSAVDITSSFLEPSKDVVKIKTKQSEKIEETYYTPVNNTELPMVILLNRGSASASEIVAGALREHNRAILVGEQSFGKGTVQEMIPLSNGSSLKVTIAEWFTPEGNLIHKVGIPVDIEVEKTADDFRENRTPQLDKAIELLENGEVSTILKEETIAFQ